MTTYQKLLAIDAEILAVITPYGPPAMPRTIPESKAIREAREARMR